MTCWWHARLVCLRLRMASDPDRDEAEQWLGAEYSDLSLAVPVQKILIAGWDGDLWSIEEE